MPEGFFRGRAIRSAAPFPARQSRRPYVPVRPARQSAPMRQSRRPRVGLYQISCAKVPVFLLYRWSARLLWVSAEPELKKFLSNLISQEFSSWEFNIDPAARSAVCSTVRAYAYPSPRTRTLTTSRAYAYPNPRTLTTSRAYAYYISPAAICPTLPHRHEKRFSKKRT